MASRLPVGRGGQILLGLALLILVYAFKAFTVPILEKGSVATLQGIAVNGDRQYLLTRGRNRENPVLLFVHGGPGMPAMFLAHSFQRELERDFVMVHWDQRAAGKSFATGTDPSTISTSQYLDDLFVVVDRLRQQFGQNKIYLLGHSHGSYLGVLAASQKPDLFKAYIGVMSRAFLGQLDAPQKAFIEIDDAAHFPFYEQPERFAAVMRQIRAETSGFD